MEIFGCDNLVSLKVENTMDMQCFLPYCNLVKINGSKHLVTQVEALSRCNPLPI